MKDRLLQLLAAEKLTALKFAEIMEVRPSNISHILSGRNNPNFDFVSRLLLRFPDMNPDWLINGIGEMYRGVNPVVLAPINPVNSLQNLDDESNTQMATLFSSSDIKSSEIDEPGVGASEKIKSLYEVQSVSSTEANPNVVESVGSTEANPNVVESVGSTEANSNTVIHAENVTNVAQPKQIIMFFDDNSFKIYTPQK